MAKKRIRTRSKSNKRRPYKKRTQKKRKKSTKRGGAAVNPAADDPFPVQVQGRSRQKRQSLPGIPEGRVVEQGPLEEGAELTKTTTVRREDMTPINQVEWGSLDPEKKELAKSLGWVNMENNDLLIEGPIPHYEWRILDYEDQDKAIALGYDEKSWNEIGERRIERQREETPFIEERRGDQPFRRTDSAETLERTDSAETLERTDSDVTVAEGELERTTTPVLPGNTEEVERLIRDLISLLREEYKKYVDKYYSNENKTPEEKKQDYMDFLDEYYDIILNKEEDLIRLLQ